MFLFRANGLNRSICLTVQIELEETIIAERRIDTPGLVIFLRRESF